MRFVKPMDNAMIEQLSLTHDLLVTLEDGAIQGGAGSAINEQVMQRNFGLAVLNLGIPDAYIAHATREEQLESIGLDAAGIIEQIKHYADGKYCM
jgi:1-deoxy-D-xylulose-5-phosphate synthase